MDVMIDLETMSTANNAQIVQIAAVMFEPVSGGKIFNSPKHTFNQFVRIDSRAGVVDHDTFCFWATQGLAGRRLFKNLRDNAEPLPDVLDKLSSWISDAHSNDGPFPKSWKDITNVWAKGSDFDFPIIKSAHAVCGKEVPWKFWQHRCARTLMRTVLGSDPAVDAMGLTKHDALDDCIIQSMQVQKTLGSFVVK